MRGAEFSPSAKRSKINRSSRARGASISTLALANGELAPPQPGAAGAGGLAPADEPASSGIVASAGAGVDAMRGWRERTLNADGAKAMVAATRRALRPARDAAGPVRRVKHGDGPLCQNVA